LNVPIVEMMASKRITGRINGTVICQNICGPDAPSTRAAS
jgi:hypothetical protein